MIHTLSSIIITATFVVSSKDVKSEIKLHQNTQNFNPIIGLENSCKKNDLIESRINLNEPVKLNKINAGTCTNFSDFVINQTSTELSITLNPWKCGVEDDRDESDVKSFSSDILIEIEFSKILNEEKLRAYSFQVKCNYEEEYNTQFSLSRSSDSDNMVISGMATSFQINQYTDETFTSLKQTLTPTEAGDQIFLEISPTSLDHSVFNFAPTMCKVVDVESGLEFTIYDIETNKCSEPVLGFSLVNTGYRWKMQYTTFLFSQESAVMNLHCKVALCTKQIVSGCNKVRNLCDEDIFTSTMMPTTTPLTTTENPLNDLEDLECEVGEDVSDRPELYASLQATLCGIYEMYMPGVTCTLANVICLGEGQFSFDIKLTYDAVSRTSYSEVFIQSDSQVVSEKVQRDLDNQFPQFEFTVSGCVEEETITRQVLVPFVCTVLVVT